MAPCRARSPAPRAPPRWPHRLQRVASADALELRRGGPLSNRCFSPGFGDALSLVPALTREAPEAHDLTRHRYARCPVTLILRRTGPLLAMTMTQTRRRSIVLAALLGLMASCGGGGSGSDIDQPPPVQPVTPAPPDPPIVSGTTLPSDVHWQPPTGATPSQGNYVYLYSEPGEEVGRGGSWLYTDADSTVVWGYYNYQYFINIGDTERQWGAVFGMNALRAGFHGGAGTVGVVSPSIRWSLQGRECATTRGWFVVDALSGDDIELRFKYECFGSTAALRGKVRLKRSESRRGPIPTAPAALWQPPDSANLPASGSYVYFESSQGDYAGRGQSRLYTPQNASLDIISYTSPRRFHQIVAQKPTERFAGNVVGIDGKLTVGYYPGVDRSPYNVSGVGGMEWGLDQRGCGRVNGWMAVDEVVQQEDYILFLVMRFEQRCDLSRATLRGKVVISVLDILPPPGPVSPPPLWEPGVGVVPQTGDFLYLESEVGDTVGRGRTHLYTASNARLLGAPYLNSFHLQAQGDTQWIGDFRAMSSIATLEKGHYARLGPMAAHDPALGGLTWRADGRACAGSSGWVVIDELTRAADGSVSRLDLRFEQRCEGDSGALRGKLRWTAESAGGGLPLPVPDALWQPPPGLVPETGNYLYVESDYLHAIGSGDTVVLTHDNAILGVNFTDPARFRFANFGVYADTGSGSLSFTLGTPAVEGPSTAGFQGNLRDSSFNPAYVDLTWRSLNCTERSAWYSIDAIAFNGDAVDSFEARFGHSCDGTPGMLRGKVRWSAGDVRPPPGPKPIPPGLWQPPDAVLPTVGNYVYLESDYGDDVGNGRTYLFTEPTRQFRTNGSTRPPVLFGLTAVTRDGIDAWTFEFEPMSGQQALQVGFYDGAERRASGNPAVAKMTASHIGSFCNRLSGWWAVDAVTYDPDGYVSAIELRFEHHCERRSAALRGMLRWVRS